MLPGRAKRHTDSLDSINNLGAATARVPPSRKDLTMRHSNQKSPRYGLRHKPDDKTPSSLRIFRLSSTRLMRRALDWDTRPCGHSTRVAPRPPHSFGYHTLLHSTLRPPTCPHKILQPCLHSPTHSSTLHRPILARQGTWQYLEDTHM
jgi:hypothetical protein